MAWSDTPMTVIGWILGIVGLVLIIAIAIGLLALGAFPGKRNE